MFEATGIHYCDLCREASVSIKIDGTTHRFNKSRLVQLRGAVAEALLEMEALSHD